MADTHQQRTRPERGQTILEIVTAIFVFMLAGSGILGASISSHQLSQAAGHTMEAVSDLNDLMECIRATPFATLQATFPGGVADGGGVTNYATLIGGYTLKNEQMTVTYPSQAPTRVEVLVTLNWVEQGRARSLQLSTVRTN